MKGGDRRSKPEAIRQLHGSKPRPRHAAQPQFGVLDAPDRPTALSASEKAFWAYYAPILAGARVLTAGDVDTLRRYCEALAQIEDIRTQQQAPEYRRVTVNDKGRAETHPLDAQLRNWVGISRLCAADLGLTPAARARVATVGMDAENSSSPLAKLQAQARQLRAV